MWLIFSLILFLANESASVVVLYYAKERLQDTIYTTHTPHVHTYIQVRDFVKRYLLHCLPTVTQ